MSFSPQSETFPSAFWYAGQAVPEGSTWESRLIQPHANAIPFFVTFRVHIQLHEQILTSQKYQKHLRGGRPLSMFSTLEESHGAPAEGGSGNAEQESLVGSVWGETFQPHGYDAPERARPVQPPNPSEGIASLCFRLTTATMCDT